MKQIHIDLSKYQKTNKKRRKKRKLVEMKQIQ